MLFLLDTNAFTDFMANHPRLQARINGLGQDDQVITCPIVRGEIIFGIERLAPGKRREELMERPRFRFASVAVYPILPDVGDSYSRIKIARRKLGIPMDENDLWIASTAISLGAVLVTRDSDFRHVQGLKIEDWTR